MTNFSGVSYALIFVAVVLVVIVKIFGNTVSAFITVYVIVLITVVISANSEIVVKIDDGDDS